MDEWFWLGVFLFLQLIFDIVIVFNIFIKKKEDI